MRSLRSMGVAWFVAYKYYEVIDNNYTIWQRAGTLNLRQSNFNNSLDNHIEYLLYSLSANDSIGTNSMNIPAQEIRIMANKILKKLKEKS